LKNSDFDYRTQFGVDYHQARRIPARAENWISELRARKLQQWIGSEDRVLEYGVGYGWNLARLKCSKKVGFDLSPDLRASVEKKGIRFEDREEALEEKGFDAVVVHHALEHIRNPQDCLRGLQRFVSAKGKLILQVPFEREKKYRRLRGNDRAHHLSSWTPASLCNLVRTTGWKLQSANLQRFRFDRLAGTLNCRLGGGYMTFTLIHMIGLALLPEYEVALLAQPLSAAA